MAIRIKKGAEALHTRRLSPVEGAKVYAALRQNVVKAGILDRDYGYYAFFSLVDIGLFILFVYLLIIQQNPLLVLASIVGIAFFTVRMGGLIHDAGHRAIFKSSFLNDVYGYFCSFLIAFPYIVWRVRHNAHHAHTNEEGEDPDVEVPISFTETMFRRNTLVVRLMRKNQAWLYYVLGPLLSFSIRFKAFSFIKENFTPRLTIDVVLLVTGLILWYIVPFVFLPMWKALMFFAVVNLLQGFYMLNVFAPNHKGMPYLEKGAEFSFVEHQVMTARNLYGHWLTDYVYLGLNYQIEHHLFTNCPRNKLPQITPFVKKICRQYKLPYTQTGIIEMNKIIYNDLKQISHNTSLSS